MDVLSLLLDQNNVLLFTPIFRGSYRELIGTADLLEVLCMAKGYGLVMF